ncbi:uncharacterized protein ARMOST_16333 [Armillaria ostoyae]|uniref:Uncharacterized protein n=1 Tax=Armillaria ostoyae TaxID=47428 RepID=A0A284RVW2_ARMOS|nr:uncharacterized protein ARMOST_16333 [Armillaria ostoyae]
MSEQATMISHINEDNSGYSNSAYSEGAYSGNASAMTTVTEETIMPQPAQERYTGPNPITNDFDMLSTMTMPLPRIVVTPPNRARSSVDDITRFSLSLEAYIFSSDDRHSNRVRERKFKLSLGTRHPLQGPKSKLRGRIL